MKVLVRSLMGLMVVSLVAGCGNSKEKKAEKAVDGVERMNDINEGLRAYKIYLQINGVSSDYSISSSISASDIPTIRGLLNEYIERADRALSAEAEGLIWLSSRSGVEQARDRAHSYLASLSSYAAELNTRANGESATQSQTAAEQRKVRVEQLLKEINTGLEDANFKIKQLQRRHKIIFSRELGSTNLGGSTANKILIADMTEREQNALELDLVDLAQHLNKTRALLNESSNYSEIDYSQSRKIVGQLDSRIEIVEELLKLVRSTSSKSRAAG